MIFEWDSRRVRRARLIGFAAAMGRSVRQPLRCSLPRCRRLYRHVLESDGTMTEVADPFQLSRFIEAQDRVFDTVLAELGAGRKQTHWMWFVFPQLRALGRSSIAKFYGIGSIEEARAYLRHPVLGKRLVQATDAVPSLSGRSAHEIFGSPDDLKFRSSMTLFGEAAGKVGAAPFQRAIERFFAGEPDRLTLEILIGGTD